MGSWLFLVGSWRTPRVYVLEPWDVVLALQGVEELAGRATRGHQAQALALEGEQDPAEGLGTEVLAELDAIAAEAVA